MGIDWDTYVLGPTVSVFGEPVTYSPAAGNGPILAIGGGAITGVFDEAYRDQDAIVGIEANTLMPVLGVRLAQFPTAPVKNDQLIRQSTGLTYIVRDVRPDGHGGAKLMLGLT
jgi:hypothetical protein